MKKYQSQTPKASISLVILALVFNLYTDDFFLSFSA